MTSGQGAVAKAASERVACSTRTGWNPSLPRPIGTRPLDSTL